MSSQLVSRLFALLILVILSSCKQPNDGYEYDESLSGPSFTGFWVYDTGTLCTAGEATMHCCPPGMALIGVHIADNVFKCAQMADPHGTRVLDIGTSRNGMHACPRGGFMVGLHANNNQLTCQIRNPGQASEPVNGPSGIVDSYPMHVCPNGHAMSGILMSDNMLTCDS